ncbi:uncharacterized protein LOC135397948 [Ornithodoros turicata]|uniref:uncharacterized protein LOC135397948 n=1 Tax=Ornithodoros turicata TaxID=34597 RepID=UPI0031390925
MKAPLAFLACALLGVAVALPTSLKSPQGTRNDDVLTAKDALETIKEAVELIRDLTEETQDPEASPRIGGKSQLTLDEIKGAIKDISQGAKPSKYTEGLKEDKTSKKTGPQERTKDNTKEKQVEKPSDESKEEFPKPAKGIVEDERELDVLNDQVEVRKDVTTLLSDDEKNKQTDDKKEGVVPSEANDDRSALEQDSHGDTKSAVALEHKKSTEQVKKPEAHVIAKRGTDQKSYEDIVAESIPTKEEQKDISSAVKVEKESSDDSNNNSSSSGSPFNPINVIRGLARPVVNAVNNIRDGVGVAFAPVVDALTPGKNSVKANESSVEENNNTDTPLDSNDTWKRSELVSEEPVTFISSTVQSNAQTTHPPPVSPVGQVAAAAAAPQGGEGESGGAPFNPINAIREFAKPVIDSVNNVRDQISSALSPVVDAITPGKSAQNTTVENGEQPESPLEPEEPGLYSESERQYTNYKLISTHIGNDTASLAAVAALQNVPKVDLWNHPLANSNVTILLAPELSDKVEANLREVGLDVTVLTENLQSWLEREKVENEPGLFLEQRDINNFAYDKYHSFEEISGYVDLIAQKYSNIATVRNLGVSQEGRPIKGIALSTGGSKPVIWIDGGIHAREWISPASVVHFLGRMTSGFGSDATVTKLLQTFDFYIFPVVNPDGYAYTFSSDRLWRKNRSGSQYGCRGVDPNRNFDTAFGGAGTSRHPCSDIYRGAYAFSEAESRAVRDGVLQLGSRVKAYVNVHSYSQLLMVPYGNGRGTYSRDYADQIAAARAASRAIQQKSGVYYQVGTISNLLGPAAGSSVDWAYDGARVKYSLAVELRDKGQFGFLLPNHLILPTAEEIFEGLVAFTKYIARRELNQEISGSTIEG